jgi:hypothetical protein
MRQNQKPFASNAVRKMATRSTCWIQHSIWTTFGQKLEQKWLISFFIGRSGFISLVEVLMQHVPRVHQNHVLTRRTLAGRIEWRIARFCSLVSRLVW